MCCTNVEENEQVQNDSTRMTDLDVMNHVRNVFEIKLKPKNEFVTMQRILKSKRRRIIFNLKRFTDTRTHQTMEYVYNFETGILSKWIVRSVITRMPNYSIAIERLKYEY